MASRQLPNIRVGLRERRKEETRRRITDVAFKLFAERGFDRVTVAEIARKAAVAQKTVFNYFPTKEDLVYGRMEEYETELLEAVAHRPPGESLVSAFRNFIVQPRGLLAEAGHQDRFKAAMRMIESTPALKARERETFANETDRFAELIARETSARPESIEPWVVANALTGVHHSFVAYVRRRVLAGVDNQTIAKEMLKQADAAISRLAEGLGSYDVKQS